MTWVVALADHRAAAVRIALAIGAILLGLYDFKRAVLACVIFWIIWSSCQNQIVDYSTPEIWNANPFFCAMMLTLLTSVMARLGSEPSGEDFGTLKNRWVNYWGASNRVDPSGQNWGRTKVDQHS